MKKLLSKSALVLMFVFVALCLPGKAGAQIQLPGSASVNVDLLINNYFNEKQSYTVSYSKIPGVLPVSYILGSVDVRPGGKVWDPMSGSWILAGTWGYFGPFTVFAASFRLSLSSQDGNHTAALDIYSNGEDVTVTARIDSGGNIQLTKD